jgi:hypothetical protein
MRSDERVRSRTELDERARSARRCLEEAERELAAERRRTSLREWLLTVMRLESARQDGTDGSH